MMTPGRANFRIYQGSTFNQIFRWESKTLEYAIIEDIAKSAPCIITVAAGQPLPPPSWRIRVTGSGGSGSVGMKEINLIDQPEKYYVSTDIVGRTVSINEINSVNYGTYISGGVLSWYQPVPLTGLSAEMQIRKNISSTEIIAELSSADGDIEFDDIDKTIKLTIPKTVTVDFDFTTAVYSFEITNSLGSTFTFLQGNLTLVKEVTR